MSLSDDAQLATQALQRLRGLRADRADRLLHKALLEQRGLNLRIEQARTAVEQARLHESRQRAALLNRYQGQAVSRQMLSGWDEALRKGAAHTAQQVDAWQSLLEQQSHADATVERARKQASECQRQVEKFREMLLLLAEEGACPNPQD